MAQYQVTLDHLLNQSFIGESRDAGVAALLETVLNQVLKAQATEQLPASEYERTPDRQGQRNGSYSRNLTTRVGRITLQIPRVLVIQSTPCLLKKAPQPASDPVSPTAYVRCFKDGANHTFDTCLKGLKDPMAPAVKLGECLHEVVVSVYKRYVDVGVLRLMSGALEKNRFMVRIVPGRIILAK